MSFADCLLVLQTGFGFSKSNRQLDLTKKILKTYVYFDNIIVGSEFEEKYKQNLKLVLNAVKTQTQF